MEKVMNARIVAKSYKLGRNDKNSRQNIVK